MKDFTIRPIHYIDHLDFFLRYDNFLKKRYALVNELKKNKEIYKKQFNLSNDNFEGLFFAKTYKLPLYFEASSIIRMLLNESMIIWNDKFKKQVQKHNLDKNEVLTIASIITVETRDISEQKKLARKIILDDREDKYLNLDSPIAYFLKYKTTKVTEFHRKHAYIDYNTYKNKGLPPGPIGAPTEKAVQIAIDALVEAKNR